MLVLLKWLSDRIQNMQCVATHSHCTFDLTRRGDFLTLCLLPTGRQE